MELRHWTWETESDLVLWFLGDPAADWLQEERRTTEFYASGTAMERVEALLPPRIQSRVAKGRDPASFCLRSETLEWMRTQRQMLPPRNMMGGYDFADRPPTCLAGCVAPSRGLHHCKCPNRSGPVDPSPVKEECAGNSSSWNTN